VLGGQLMIGQPMTSQYAFDTVWKHFVQDRNAPGMANGVCTLRGAGGTRCAIGLLIPDRFYEPAMENKRVVHLIKRFPTLAAVFAPIPSSVLARLQIAHDFAATAWAYDGADFHAEIEALLIEVARLYKLRLPMVEEA